MFTYTISELARICNVVTRHTWYRIIKDNPDVFKTEKQGQVVLISTTLNRDEIKKFYKKHKK